MGDWRIDDCWIVMVVVVDYWIVLVVEAQAEEEVVVVDVVVMMIADYDDDAVMVMFDVVRIERELETLVDDDDDCCSCCYCWTVAMIEFDSSMTWMRQKYDDPWTSRKRVDCVVVPMSWTWRMISEISRMIWKHYDCCHW